MLLNYEKHARSPPCSKARGGGGVRLNLLRADLEHFHVPLYVSNIDNHGRNISCFCCRCLQINNRFHFLHTGKTQTVVFQYVPIAAPNSCTDDFLGVVVTCNVYRDTTTHKPHKHTQNMHARTPRTLAHTCTRAAHTRESTQTQDHRLLRADELHETPRAPGVPKSSIHGSGNDPQNDPFFTRQPWIWERSSVRSFLPVNHGLGKILRKIFPTNQPWIWERSSERSPEGVLFLFLPFNHGCGNDPQNDPWRGFCFSTALSDVTGLWSFCCRCYHRCTFKRWLP